MTDQTNATDNSTPVTTATVTTSSTPSVDPKTEPKFAQADMDALAGNVRKEAAAAARKALLKELGLDPDDPKAVDAVKSKLTAAQQAEDAQKTAETKALEKIAQLEKERDDAKLLADKEHASRVDSVVNSKLETLASKAGALHAADVIDYLRTKTPDKVKELMNADETVDEKKAADLITEVKKARDNWFVTARGAGIPSISGGTTPGMDDKAAREASFKRSRRAV